MSIITANITPSLSGARLITHHFTTASTSTNPTVVAPGRRALYGWAITCATASARYLCFHDTGVAPIAGSAIYFKYGIPGNGSSNQNFTIPIPFINGLSYTTVVAPADTDATATTTNDLLINLFYI